MSQHQPRWKAIVTYAYASAQGATLYFVERQERIVNNKREKRFRQYRLDGDGKKIWNLDSIPGVPYCLPDLLGAIAHGETIIVPEGEKDVDNLRTQGFVATTNSCGAGWIWTPEFAQYFRGAARIVFVADNDSSGRESARRNAKALAGIAHEVRILENLPNVSEKGDVSDLIDAGWTNEKLTDLLKSATLVESIEDGAKLLEDMVFAYNRFVVMTQEQAETLALYALHTHAFSASDVTPYVLLRSPEKRSGKTLLLRISKQLCKDAVLAASVTPAALFRLISARAPTFFIDEIDTIYGAKQGSERNEDIRAVLNAGFERGAMIPRCVGNSYEVQLFEVFCPKMLAGLRCQLPDTILDRCIVFEMRRKAPDERVERFRRRRDTASLRELGDRSKRWAEQNECALAQADPDLPNDLSDRAKDLWEPLLAIADLVGGTWPARARKAASVLSGSEVAEDESEGGNGTELLTP